MWPSKLVDSRASPIVPSDLDDLEGGEARVTRNDFLHSVTASFPLFEGSRIYRGGGRVSVIFRELGGRSAVVLEEEGTRDFAFRRSGIRDVGRVTVQGIAVMITERGSGVRKIDPGDGVVVRISPSTDWLFLRSWKPSLFLDESPSFSTQEKS